MSGSSVPPSSALFVFALSAISPFGAKATCDAFAKGVCNVSKWYDPLDVRASERMRSIADVGNFLIRFSQRKAYYHVMACDVSISITHAVKTFNTINYSRADVTGMPSGHGTPGGPHQRPLLTTGDFLI